jgi:hypothetical protein
VILLDLPGRVGHALLPIYTYRYLYALAQPLASTACCISPLLHRSGARPQALCEGVFTVGGRAYLQCASAMQHLEEQSLRPSHENESHKRITDEGACAIQAPEPTTPTGFTSLAAKMRPRSYMQQ